MRVLTQSAHRPSRVHPSKLMAGGPSVDRTLTGGGETLALTLAQVTEEPR